MASGWLGRDFSGLVPPKVVFQKHLANCGYNHNACPRVCSEESHNKMLNLSAQQLLVQRTRLK